jgi:citrate lyase subunit beta / citryl-CoA lyase
MRLRSVLFTPGDRGDRYTKALQEGKADCVVADLEDAVAPERKQEARRQVVEALQAVPKSKAVRAVRVNAWSTGLARDDLDAVLPGRPDLIAVAKVQSPHEVAELDVYLRRLEDAHGIEPGATRLMLHLETAAGVLDARAIASSNPRVEAVAFGAEDLAADAGLRRSDGNAEVAYARAHVALCAAAAGVRAVDMITADPRDLERTAREATEARALGYAGKMCIHPLQVVAVHEAYRATPQELAWARRVVAAADAAGAGQGGIVVVDGRMVDVPFIRQARRLLESRTDDSSHPST